MSVHFSQLKQHKNVVCGIYRSILRNSIHLDKLDRNDHLRLITKIRCMFRKNTNVVNSLVTQRLIRKAIKINNLIVEAYDDQTKLEKFITKKSLQNWVTLKQSATNASENSDLPPISNKIRKNPLYENLTDDEIREFRSTKEIDLPESTTTLIPNIHIHARWYFNKNKYPSLKTKLDKRYMRTIFPSLIAYEKQKYHLDNLTRKLESQPSHKLRRVSGAGRWIYLINTPWNRDLRTENFKFIGDTRREYDEIIIKLQECEKYRKEYENFATDEAKWEISLETEDCIDKRGTIEDWKWLFKQAELELENQRINVEKSITEFCKRQGLIYEQIKPLFDDTHEHSKLNLSILQLEIKKSQVGPYTDIIDGGLGNIFKKYGFRDPVETKNAKKKK